MSYFLYSSVLFIVYHFVLSHSVSQDICTFSPDGGNTTYDLSPFSEMGKIHTTDETNQHFDYYFSICQNLTGHPCNPDVDQQTGCIQQWDYGSCTYWLSAWTANPSLVDFGVNESFPEQGILLEFDNGEVCYSDHGRDFPYRTQFRFLCDKTKRFEALPVHQNEHETCLFELTLKSYYACAGYNPHTKSGITQGLSMGFVAIILFFVAIILGLIVYYIVLGIKNKNWGTESMAPPLNLCKSFWMYSCVGCKVSIEWMTNKSKKKEPDNYEQIS